MIIGVGIDVVDEARFARQLERTPALRERLFSPAERELGLASLAARFAAKEALAKSLGAPVGMRWQDVTVIRPHGSPPRLAIRGTVAERAAERGVTTFHLSISHDGGIATAIVIAERRDDVAVPTEGYGVQGGADLDTPGAPTAPSSGSAPLDDVDDVGR